MVPKNGMQLISLTLIHTLPKNGSQNPVHNKIKGIYIYILYYIIIMSVFIKWVAETRILRWLSWNTLKDRIWNGEICLKIGVTPIDERWGRVAWDD